MRDYLRERSAAELEDRDSEQEYDPRAHAVRARMAEFRARATIAQSPNYRAEFAADPELCMQRFGVARAEYSPALPTPEGGATPIHVAGSDVHGQGVFASQGVRAGQTIVKMLNPTRDDVSDAASKVNSSQTPNALPVSEGGGLVLKATQDIPAGREVLSRYNFPK
ncbi:MAG: SET domain-containing protein-lysine N-methyltransferase [Deltaproteobacteria bacterium]|nr:SET domain-containing protein-lysine N-methyltransferase [Deltaproteobacteria bacterium]